ncbi:MAG: LptF/LptG family permease [Caldimicrobium sp.]
MRIFYKFFIKEFSKNFLLSLLIFIAFFLVGEFFEKFPSFLASKRPLVYFLEYLFWKVQVNLYQIFPYIIGLASLLSVFFLSRSFELLAFLSLGFLRKELLKAYVVIIFVFSIFGGLFLNFTVPKAFYKSEYVWDVKIENKRTQYLIFKDMLFFEGENFILIAIPLEPKAEYLADFILFFLKDIHPEKIFWAKKALYLGNKIWRLEEAIIQEAKDGFQPKFSAMWEGELPLSPKTFVVVEKSVKFASFKELYQRYLFLKMIKKPYYEVWVEFLNRVLYLFIGLTISLFPLTYYLKNYSPQRYISLILHSLIIYFFMSVIILLVQTFTQKILWMPLFIIFFTIFFTIYLISSKGLSSPISSK